MLSRNAMDLEAREALPPILPPDADTKPVVHGAADDSGAFFDEHDDVWRCTRCVLPCARAH